MPSGERPPDDLVNDRYSIEEELGAGGMGTVYRAHDRVLRRTVAVKTLRRDLAGEEFERRFDREAAILARLRSPHIVTVYDFGRSGGQFFLVTDYYPDGDLAAYVDTAGTMRPAAALRLLSQVADGLADAHEVGVVHRDVKPANILLFRRSGELHAVLADFGIAVTEDLSLTGTGGVVGSPLYMAPERHLGETATATTDVYALGCVLHTVLTGHPPYWEEGQHGSFQAASAHLNAPVPTLPDTLPRAADLNALLARCMAKSPADRVASAAVLAEEMRELAAEMTRSPSNAATTVVTPSRPAPAVARPRGRRRRGAAALVVLLLGAVAGGLAWTGQDDDPGPAAGTTRPGSSPPEEADDPPVTVDDPEAPETPAAPAAPDVRSTPAAYAVRFSVATPPPADGVTYEVERGEDWSATGPRFRLPTGRPGVEACTPVRVVAVTAGGDRVPGRPGRACGRSSERDIELLLVRADCEPELVGYPASISCRWFDVVLTGFRPGRRVQVVPTADGQPGANPPTVTVEDDGSAVLGARISPAIGPVPGGFPVPDLNEELVIEADGVSRAFDLDDYRS